MAAIGGRHFEINIQTRFIYQTHIWEMWSLFIMQIAILWVYIKNIILLIGFIEKNQYPLWAGDVTWTSLICWF